jgi:hypothetical protein
VDTHLTWDGRATTENGNSINQKTEININKM